MMNGKNVTFTPHIIGTYNFKMTVTLVNGQTFSKELKNIDIGSEQLPAKLDANSSIAIINGLEKGYTHKLKLEVIERPKNNDYIQNSFGFNTTSEVLVYTGINLPNGVIVNKNTGEITWTPTIVGDYNFGVKVKSLNKDCLLYTSPSPRD